MRGVSEDFRTELGRHNYVTPTSYLELITMFQRLLTAKRVENSKTLSRYTVGLDKLQSSAEQVAGMQQELRVSCTLPAGMQPILLLADLQKPAMHRLPSLLECLLRFTSQHLKNTKHIVQGV